MPRAARRRSGDPIVFNGRTVDHTYMVELWNDGASQRKWSRYRTNMARDIRRKTTVVQLRPTWVNRHPEAADWVVKVLPERRTLERDLIASIAAVDPTYKRVALGDLDRDSDYAEACEGYLEEWRKEYVPSQKFAEKATEDGEHGLVVIPTHVDMDGCPDFYDRLDEAAYDALDDERRSEYGLDEDDPKGRYAGKNEDGSRRTNPTYDRDARGKPRGKDQKDFERDDDKSKEAHQKAVQRYLLKQEQGAVTVRVIPANDCIPYLVRGTKREPWKLFAMVERTLYFPEELPASFGWRGMGDRALIPRGYDATRTSGQNGMYYLYTLYIVWTDPNDPKKIKRPLMLYSVGGHPTWSDDPPADQELPGNGVAVIDLHEELGLEGPFWHYGGGLHTSDDDPDFYYEPYLWPFVETILGIEGMSTMVNAATAVNATPGYWHEPDHNLLALDDEGLVDASTQELKKPTIPDSGEIETTMGKVYPATPATVSADAWRVIQSEYESLRANTTLEQPGAGSQPSGHAMVVKETIAQTAKRHIREWEAEATRFCGEKALMIFAAIAREHKVCWPLQKTKEKPVGAEMREYDDILEFDPEWVGDGEYKLATAYPAEPNPVREELEMAKAERGFGSFEDVAEAGGKTDAESEWAKVLKWRIRQHPAYIEAQVTRLAKKQGNRLMLQVLKLQKDQRMTTSGAPGFENGLPAAALRGGGESGGGINGGPTTAQRSLGGMKAAEIGPQMNDARAQAMLPGQQGAA